MTNGRKRPAKAGRKAPKRPRKRLKAAAPTPEPPAPAAAPAPAQMAAEEVGYLLTPGTLLFAEDQLLAGQEELLAKGHADAYRRQASLDVQEFLQSSLNNSALRSVLSNYEEGIVQSFGVVLQKAQELASEGLLAENPTTAVLTFVVGFFRVAVRALEEITLDALAHTTVRRSSLWDGTDSELSAVAMAHLEVFIRASLREKTVEAYEKRIRSALSPDEETQQLRKYSQALVQMLQNPRMPRA